MMTTTPDWRDQAACAGHDTALFFDHKPARALAICHTCPVRVECLDDELETMRAGVLTAGVRGGTLPAERHNLIGRTYPHGTNSGYHAHRRNRETACPDCLRAHREHARRWEAAR